MSTRARLSVGQRDVLLDSLLRQHPDAWVVAIDHTGLFTTMPAEVPLGRHRVIEGLTTGVELAAPSDRTLVVDTWRRAVEEGGANATIHPVDQNASLVQMHLIDMTHRYGVYIGIFLGFPSTDAAPPSDERVTLVPRRSQLRKDQVATVTEVDDAASAMLGWSREDLLGRRMVELMHPDDQPSAMANWVDMLAHPGQARRVRSRHLHRDGSWRWLEVTNTNHLDDPDDPHVLTEMVDVTDEIAALDALRANENLLRRLTEALPVGVLHIGQNGAVTYCNEMMSTITGASGDTITEQLATVVPSDRDRAHDAVATVLRTGHDTDVEVSLRPPMTKMRRCVMSLRALTGDDTAITGAILCLSDITDEVNLREELQRRVRFDPLTACLNHASIMSALEERLASPRSGTWTVVVFIDLDDFKGINDRYGHVIGDRLLKHVASHLRRVAGHADLVGRLGGDEFLMVLQTADNPAAVADAAQAVATAMRSPVRLGREWTTPRASIGLAYATAEPGDVDADGLVAVADAAMYDAKRGRTGLPVIAQARPR